MWPAQVLLIEDRGSRQGEDIPKADDGEKPAGVIADVDLLAIERLAGFELRREKITRTGNCLRSRRFQIGMVAPIRIFDQLLTVSYVEEEARHSSSNAAAIKTFAV